MPAECGIAAEIKVARRLRAELAARAQEFEQQRQIAPELMHQMFDAGMVQMAVPAVYGGSERPLRDTLEVIEEIARGDASAAWCLMNYQTTAFVAGLLSPSAAKVVFTGSVKAIPAGVLAPTARGRLGDDGLVVNGRWSFASGVDHANWLLGTVVIEDSTGTPITNPDGSLNVVLPFFSRDQFTIIDTWQVSGLCASGSHDVEVKDAFVPRGRWLTLADPVVVDTPLYRFPLLSTFPPCVAMVSLGTARAALDGFVELANHKVPAGGTASLRERGSAQIAIARAEAMVEAARAYVFATVDTLWGDVEQGRPASIEARRQIRLAGTFAAQVAAEAITLLYDAAGASAIQLSHALQRHLRDARVVTQHLQVSSAGFERMGQLLLTGDQAGPL